MVDLADYFCLGRSIRGSVRKVAFEPECKKMYLKNKEVGRERAFLIGGTIRKDMDEKNGKHVQGPVGSLVLLKCKGDQWG